MSQNESAEPGSFRARRAVFTINNPQESGEDIKGILEAEGCKYAVFQLERGEQGTLHFQGYMHYHKDKRFGPPFRALFKETIWIKRAHGSARDNRSYCTKPEGREGGPWEIGEVPEGQGERTDLKAFYQEVKSGKRLRDLADEHCTILAKYPRYYATILGLSMPVLRPDGVRVVLHHGKTGIGKTRAVMEEYAGNPEFYVSPLTNSFWMDGYDGQKVVLMDDFTGAASKISLTFALRLFDRYPVQVPVKGAFVWWCPEVIHITTNNHPRLWYKWDNREGQYAALLRRFSSIKKDLVELDAFQRREYEDWRPPIQHVTGNSSWTH